jgi:uncharacterized damage-inducible protein DinB
MNTLRNELESTANELLQLLSSFDQEQINVVPFEGSWTAGQLARHVIKSQAGFAEIMNGPVKDSDRKPDEKAEKIKADFLNFNIKMKSPDFIVPENKTYNKEALLQSLETLKAKITEEMETKDLTQTCLAFELPMLGHLTRLEAVYFVIYHTQRHIHQLKNILRKITNPQELAQ